MIYARLVWWRECRDNWRSTSKSPSDVRLGWGTQRLMGMTAYHTDARQVA